MGSVCFFACCSSKEKTLSEESFSVKYLSPEGRMMSETQASGPNLDCFAEHPLSCTLDPYILTFGKNLYCDLIFKH